MKILFIGHEKGINGASKSLLSIISQLEKEHEIYVLTAFPEGEFFEALKNYKVKVIVKPFFLWKIYKTNIGNWIYEKIKWYLYHNILNHISAKKISKIIINQKIDIIHSNSGVINIGALISKYSNIPHIWHIREFGDLDFNMYPMPRYSQYKRFMNFYTDKFILISKSIFDYYDYLEDNKKKLIYNGIDSINLVIEKNFHFDCIIFLLAGRISPEKGQEEAIEAVKILYNRGIKQFKLLLAGQMVNRINIPIELKDYIQYLGVVKDIFELRKKVDIELVCSKSEAFGRVTAEAMMIGNPVIGSNCGGTPELIINNKTGLLYNSGDSVDLANKMEFLINNPENIRLLGKHAREYALKNFTIERCVKEITDVYFEIINNRDSAK